MIVGKFMWTILRPDLHNGGVGPGVERDVVHLRDKDGDDCDEERGAIHIHRGAEWQYKATNLFGNAGFLLNTF